MSRDRQALNKRVLVVEDEALLAIDIAEELSLAGFIVVGPATSVTKALHLIEELGCDVAILDVNIRGETSEKIAMTLRDSGTPFFMLSGISEDQIQSWFVDAPLVSKPVQFDTLFAALHECIGGVGDR